MIPLFQKEERPTMAEFNERITQANTDIEKAQDTADSKAKIATGSYVGDVPWGESGGGRTISVGFHPNAVLVEQINGSRSADIGASPTGGIALRGKPLYSEGTEPYVTVTSSGFELSGAAYNDMNRQGYIYYYIAFG